MSVDPWRVVVDACTQAREALKAAVQTYCDYHDITPAFDVTRVFETRRATRAPVGGERLVIARMALVDLDDDVAWKVICPVGHRWWDVDLYPELAEREGIVGITTSRERSEVPQVRPAGIMVHRDSPIVR